MTWSAHRFAGVLSRVRSLAKEAVDFCYPGACALCEEGCEPGALLCGKCDGELRELEEQAFCRKCARPLSRAGMPCPYCVGRGFFPFERIVALGVFDGPLKELVHQFKYHGNWPVAERLAERLLLHERFKELLSETEVLVPVPLHPLKQIQRGYNQAEVIARRLGRRCRIPVRSAVVRLRNTQTQTHLHADAHRHENVRHAFAAVEGRAVRGRHVAIVEDVTTTGWTLKEVARAIRTADPASLSVVVLAVADPRKRKFESI
jgi:ComF family protein